MNSESAEKARQYRKEHWKDHQQRWLKSVSISRFLIDLPAKPLVMQVFRLLLLLVHYGLESYAKLFDFKDTGENDYKIAVLFTQSKFNL